MKDYEMFKFDNPVTITKEEFDAVRKLVEAVAAYREAKERLVGDRINSPVVQAERVGRALSNPALDKFRKAKEEAK